MSAPLYRQAKSGGAASDRALTCLLCPKKCTLSPGQTGFCRARANTGAAIACTNYGKLTALNLDPIEKKPLMAFYPGSRILSAGSYGCNLSCPFCQNSSLSMADASTETVFYSPNALLDQGRRLVSSGNIGIAFTYNEPLISYEYVRDCARLFRSEGLKTVLVTNGTILEEPLLDLLPEIDAMNIDLKGYSAGYYRWLNGDLATVKNTIALSAKRCHVEVTALILPGKNDGEAEMDALSAFLASVRPDLILHVTRFFPRYRVLNLSPTPVETIRRLREVALRHLHTVYTGNC